VIGIENILCTRLRGIPDAAVAERVFEGEGTGNLSLGVWGRVTKHQRKRFEKRRTEHGRCGGARLRREVSRYRQLHRLAIEQDARTQRVHDFGLIGAYSVVRFNSAI